MTNLKYQISKINIVSLLECSIVMENKISCNKEAMQQLNNYFKICNKFIDAKTGGAYHG